MQCDKVLSEVFMRTGDSTLVRKLSSEFAICRRLVRGFEQTIKSLRQLNKDLNTENEILKRDKELTKFKFRDMHDRLGSMEKNVAMTLQYQMKQTHELMKQKDEKLDEFKTNLESKHADSTTKSWKTRIDKLIKCFEEIKNNIGNYADRFELLQDMERIMTEFVKTTRTKTIKDGSSSKDNEESNCDTAKSLDDAKDQNHSDKCIKNLRKKFNETQIIEADNSTAKNHVCSSESVPSKQNVILKDGVNVNGQTCTNYHTDHLNYTSKPPQLYDLYDEFMNEQTPNYDAIKGPEDEIKANANSSSKDPLDELFEELIINEKKFKSEQVGSLSLEQTPKNADLVLQSDNIKDQSSCPSSTDSTLEDPYTNYVIIEEYEVECMDKYNEIKSTNISNIILPYDCGNTDPAIKQSNKYDDVITSESTERKYNLRKRKSINYAVLQSGDSSDNNQLSADDFQPKRGRHKIFKISKTKTNFHDNENDTSSPEIKKSPNYSSDNNHLSAEDLKPGRPKNFQIAKTKTNFHDNENDKSAPDNNHLLAEDIKPRRPKIFQIKTKTNFHDNENDKSASEIEESPNQEKNVKVGKNNLNLDVSSYPANDKSKNLADGQHENNVIENLENQENVSKIEINKSIFDENGKDKSIPNFSDKNVKNIVLKYLDNEENHFKPVKNKSNESSYHKNDISTNLAVKNVKNREINNMKIAKIKSSFVDDENKKSPNNLLDIDQNNLELKKESKFDDNEKNDKSIILENFPNQQKGIIVTNGVANSDFKDNSISENFLFPLIDLMVTFDESGNRFVNEISIPKNESQHLIEIQDKSDLEKTNYINGDQYLESNLQLSARFTKGSNLEKANSKFSNHLILNNNEINDMKVDIDDFSYSENSNDSEIINDKFSNNLIPENNNKRKCMKINIIDDSLSSENSNSSEIINGQLATNLIPNNKGKDMKVDDDYLSSENSNNSKIINDELANNLITKNNKRNDTKVSFDDSLHSENLNNSEIIHDKFTTNLIPTNLSNSKIGNSEFSTNLIPNNNKRENNIQVEEQINNQINNFSSCKNPDQFSSNILQIKKRDRSLLDILIENNLTNSGIRINNGKNIQDQPNNFDTHISVKDLQEIQKNNLDEKFVANVTEKNSKTILQTSAYSNELDNSRKRCTEIKINSKKVKKKIKKCDIDDLNLNECTSGQESSFNAMMLELYGNRLRPILALEDDQDDALPGRDNNPNSCGFTKNSGNYIIRKSEIPEYEIPWKWKKDLPPVESNKKMKYDHNIRDSLKTMIVDKKEVSSLNDCKNKSNNNNLFNGTSSNDCNSNVNQKLLNDCKSKLNKNSFNGPSSNNCNNKLNKNSFNGTSSNDCNNKLNKNAFNGTSSNDCNSKLNKNSFNGTSLNDCNSKLNKNSFNGTSLNDRNSKLNKNTFNGTSLNDCNSKLNKNSFNGTSLNDRNSKLNKNTFNGTSLNDCNSKLNQNGLNGTSSNDCSFKSNCKSSNDCSTELNTDVFVQRLQFLYGAEMVQELTNNFSLIKDAL